MFLCQTSEPPPHLEPDAPTAWLLQARVRLPLAVVAFLCYFVSRDPRLVEVNMVRELKLRQVGGSVGATLPKDMAERLHLEAGDRVLAVETEGGILLSPYDPTMERALAIAAKAAKKYRNALRQLAK